MRYPIALSISLCLGALAPSFAAEPAAPATPATAVATPAAQADASKGAEAAKTQSAELDAQAKRLRAAGYKPKVQNGQTVYCRKEAVVGSRFPQEVCGSAESIDKVTQNGKDLADDVQRKQANPLLR
jgi:uncharacterized protein involved in type VI secretion and phage assembly